MKKANVPAIAPEMRAELIGIVKGELSSIAGLRFSHKDAEYIADRLVAQRLSGGTSASGLPQAFITTDIANKITGLAHAWRPYGATTQNVFSMTRTNPYMLTSSIKNFTDKADALLQAWQPAGITEKNIFGLYQKSPSLLGYNANTLQDKAKVIAGLLLTGDLPRPLATGQPRDFRKALRIMMDNLTYASLLARSMEEIHAIALLTRLQKISIHEALNNNNRARSDKITEHLAGITDREWKGVEHLAKEAGFVRKAPLSPDRRQLMREAAARLAAKAAQKAHG